jgi:hypothetical protein
MDTILGVIGTVTGVSSLGCPDFQLLYTVQPKLEGDAVVNHEVWDNDDLTSFRCHLNLSNKSSLVTTKQLSIVAIPSSGNRGYGLYPPDHPFHEIPPEFTIQPGTKSMDVVFDLRGSFNEDRLNFRVDFDHTYGKYGISGTSLKVSR